MTVHEKFMKLALRLAMKGKGKTSPNPVVGALLVKNGEIVGEGYHKKAGEPHAEIVAIRQANDKVRGATLYVTLEPCSHFGRTPPCTDQILRSGIKEVIVGMKDPNPLNNGRGIGILSSNRIKVRVGILEDELRKVNEEFIKFITTRRPFVTIKVAQSLDGKIATNSGDSKWITSEKARKYVHKIRSFYDAILVGVDTVIKDEPLLTSYSSGHSPIKIVVDSNLRISPNARIFSKKSPAPTILATTPSASKKRIKTFRTKGVKVLIIKTKEERVDLSSLMKKLGEMEIMSLLVEGGGEVIASALTGKLVDKVLFFVAPKLIGGRDAPTSVEGIGAERVHQAIKLGRIKTRRFGEDILVEGYVK